ncbi:MAG TPA: hypothetical protein RMI62_23825, partial [Polyangiaceae bacterium LLY-WYZ-15_(1-7)]|nr:hypothetical protein [Polyangiaceae bacterium LLY-WYZ-15_(1-7)]
MASPHPLTGTPLARWRPATLRRFTLALVSLVGAAAAVPVVLAFMGGAYPRVHPTKPAVLVALCTAFWTWFMGAVALRFRQGSAVLWLAPLFGVANAGTCAGLIVIAERGEIGEAIAMMIAAMTFGLPFGAAVGLGYGLFLGVLLGTYRSVRAKDPTDGGLRLVAVAAVWTAAASELVRALAARGIDPSVAEVAPLVDGFVHALRALATVLTLGALVLHARAARFLARVGAGRLESHVLQRPDELPASAALPPLAEGAPVAVLARRHAERGGPFRAGEAREALALVPSFAELRRRLGL